MDILKQDSRSNQGSLLYVKAKQFNSHSQYSTKEFTVVELIYGVLKNLATV